MTLTQEQQQKIVQQERAWLEDQFRSLDLSPFSVLQPRPAKSSDDQRFVKHRTDRGLSRSANELHLFVTDPDTEALSSVANETNNHSRLHDVRDRRGEAVAVGFTRRCPGYLPTNSNFRSMVETMAFNALPAHEQNLDTEDVVDLLSERGYWTVPNLVACYEALLRRGMLDVPADSTFTAAERLRMTRLVQTAVKQAVAAIVHLARLSDHNSVKTHTQRRQPFPNYQSTERIPQ